MTEQVGGAASGVKKRAWYGSVWRFFASVKLTIFVLIALALSSIIGTVIEQNQPIESYYIEYGERWGDIIRTLQLDDMYHSVWFVAQLVLLMINIIACTYERFPPKWRSLLRKVDDFDPSIIDRFSNREAIELGATLGRARDRVIEVLRKNRYKIKLDRSQGDEVKLYASRGLIGRFGSDITHVSLFVIIIGAIYGSFWGYRDFRPILVGSMIRVPDADFALRLDKFWIDYYDTGQIRQYNSLLTVIEDGKEVLTKQIWVNEPLYYKGIRFYQSSYGTSWNRIKEAEIALKRLDSNKVDPPFSVKWGEVSKVPGSKYSVRLVGYVSDFAFDERTRTVFSKSGETNNPAVQIEVYNGEDLIARPWLFFNFPGLIHAIPGTQYDLVLMGFRTIPYSGISITKDPGTNVVWVGTGIMGIGFFLAFFVYHRRIWVSIKASGNGTIVRMGGVINKNPLGFEREFKDIVEAVKETDSRA